MKALILVLAAVAVLAGPAAANDVSSNSPHASLAKRVAAWKTFAETYPDQQFASTGSDTVYNAAACCKVCKTGKACGDSCISRKYNCKKGKGCACDAEE